MYRTNTMGVLISIIKNTYYYYYFYDFRKLKNELIFPSDFNKNIDGIKIYKKTKKLDLGWRFNQSLDKVLLPEGLTRITLSEDYNKSLDNVKFPSTLKKLVINRNFNLSLDKVNFPNGFEQIEFTSESHKNETAMNSLPLTLKKLKIICVRKSMNLPIGLEKLSILYFAKSDLSKLKVPHECKVESFAKADLLQKYKL